MIRLWHRIGPVRSIAAVAVVAALGSGVWLSEPTTQHNAGNSPAVAAADTVPLTQPNGTDQQDAQGKADQAATEAADEAQAAADKARATQPASRSDNRPPGTPGTPSKPYSGPIPASCQAYDKNKANDGNRVLACTLMMAAGFAIDQAPCLVNLWNRESGFNPLAKNKGSGATGIPQALPGNRMAKYGSDWATNPQPQILWGLDYIKGRYKTPCNAWGHSQATGWY